jgi:hypothetical protein
LPDLTNEVEAIRRRYRQVLHDQIGPATPNFLHQRVSVIHRRDDLTIERKQLLEPRGDETMIVGDHDARLLHLWRYRAKSNRCTKPWILWSGERSQRRPMMSRDLDPGQDFVITVKQTPHDDCRLTSQEFLIVLPRDVGGHGLAGSAQLTGGSAVDAEPNASRITYS